MTKDRISSLILFCVAAVLLSVNLHAATLRVWPGSPTPGSPYDSWSKAAHDIQTAVDAANPGDTVLVTNGVYVTGGTVTPGYMLPNRVVIAKAITVQSINGPGVTTIQGQGPVGPGAVRCVYLTSGAGFVGFTLTGGATRSDGDSTYDQSGGGLCFDHGGWVSNCVISASSASGGAGGVTLWYGGQVINSTLSGNSAPWGGGAYLTGGGVLSGCQVTGNTCTGGGGGLFAEDGGAISNCVIAGNSVTSGGSWSGGMDLWCHDPGSNIIAFGCLVATNSTPGYGGGMDAYSENGGTVTVTQCRSLGNMAGDGGGLSIGEFTGGVSTVSQCWIEGNWATQCGGVEFYGSGLLQNCVIRQNRAQWWAGGVLLRDGSQLLNSSVFDNQCNGNGGGVEMAGACLMQNCTVVGNRAAGGGSGVFCYDAGQTLENSIVWGNEGSSLFAGTGPAYPTSNLNNCIQGWTGGGANLAADPLLIDSYHVAPASPCIGAGLPNVSTGTDLDGQAWKTTPAIGCDEYYADSTVGPSTVAILAPATTIATQYPCRFAADIIGTPSQLIWNFGDGTTLTNAAVVFHPWSDPGDYPVTLTAFHDSNPGGVSATLTVHVVANAICRVSLASLNPQPPYASWDTAATNIQDAVAACLPGGTVLVTNGVYGFGSYLAPGLALPSRVLITNDIILRSVNGPDVTRIQGQGLWDGSHSTNGPGAVRCVYLSAGQLSGFTLTGGYTLTEGDDYTDRSGGGAFALGGLLTNCTVIGNGAVQYGGGVSSGGYYVGGTTLWNCLLASNYTVNAGGAAFGSILRHCTITANQCAGGWAGGLHCCTAYDSLFTGNQAAAGGAAAYSTLVRCQVVNNQATSYGGGECNGTAQDTTFAYNNSYWGGAANNCQMTNCLLLTNTASGSGGGMCGGTFVGGRATGNTATLDGGGLSAVSAYNATLSYNHALRYGGGFWADTNYVLTGCQVIGNISDQLGGGGYGGLISNCLVTDNQSVGAGGGVYCTQGTRITGCTVSRNWVGDQTSASTPANAGGGIWADSGSIIEECVISLNRSYEGGGVYGNGLVSLTNCQVNDNSAIGGPGGGICAQYGCSLVNCTVARNSAMPDSNGNYAYGGGVYLYSPNQTNTLLNTIIYNNQCLNSHGNPLADQANWYNSYGPLVANYCCSTPALAGIGNITNAPLFVAGDAGGYQLSAVSPCINSGVNMDWMTNATDLAGHPRMAGGQVDMGAYEFGALSCFLVADRPVGVGALTNVLFTALVTGANTAGLSYIWDLNGDGLAEVTTTASNTAVFSYTGPGVWPISLLVSNAAGETASCQRDSYVRVLPANAFDFVGAPLVGAAPWTVGFTNLSVGGLVPQVSTWWGVWGAYASSYFWDLDGNGMVDSFTMNPSFVYSNIGDYTVSLTVSNNYGEGAWLAQTVTKSNYVHIPVTRLVPNFANTPVEVTAGEAVSFFDTSSNTHGVVTYAWDFEDSGTVQATGPNPVWVFTSAGYKTVTLTVTDQYTSETVVHANAVKVYRGLSPIHYADLNSPNPTAPYTNWETAAHVIQDAINVAEIWDTVLVADGVYDQNQGSYLTPGHLNWNRVVLNNAITVRSMNGPAATVISGEGDTGYEGVRGAYLAAGAVLSGFTLTNGCANWQSDDDYSHFGGGALLDGGGTLSNCVVVGNFASAWWRGVAYGGGILCVSGGTVDHCVISNNQAAASGGGIGLWGGGGLVNQCEISGNSSGGLVFCTGDVCSWVVSGCSVHDNLGSGVSGGMTVSNSLLFNNHSTTSGGGADGASLWNCRVYANLADGTGGGLQGGSAANCLLAGNTSQNNGGGANGTALTNCTVIGNRAGLVGGGLSGGSAKNSILYFNTAVIGFDNVYNDNGVEYSCVTPAHAGQGNISAEPLLAGLLNPVLLSNSPCIDRGLNLDAQGATDLAGHARTNNGTVDMGCLEHYAGGLAGPLTASIRFETTDTTTTGAPMRLAADTTGQVGGLAWSWGDGLLSTNQVVASHTYAAPGDYSVMLTAWNDQGQVSATTTVHVVQTSIHYVSLSGSNAPPYTSWESAATTVQAAVDAALPGDTVLVTNGVYNSGGFCFGYGLTNLVAINKPITVLSVNGPQATILSGPGFQGYNNATRCASVGPGASLIGFTLTNGTTLDGGQGPTFYVGAGAGVWCRESASVSNCVLVGNHTGGGGGSGGGAYGGWLYHCSFLGNSAVRGGGADSASLYDCLLLTNTAYNGGGVADCELFRCNLAANTAFDGSGGTGGGALNSLLHECVLRGNSAPNQGGGAYGGTHFNCAFIGNQAQDGGGAYNSTLMNCTLVANSGGGASGGELWNTIAYYNTNLYGATYNVFGGTCWFCCTFPRPEAGAGNLTNAPGLLSLSDWHLAASSPCVDHGTNLDWMAGASDLDGELRLNGAVDIGCDEVYASDNHGPLSVGFTMDYQTTTPLWGPALQADIQGRASGYTFDWGDGGSTANALLAQHTFSSPGDYPLVLTAWNSSGFVSATSVVHIVAATNRCVSLAGSHTPPFADWASAATNIQAAVDAANPGETVLVTNGVFATGGAFLGGTSNLVAWSKPLTVRSLNGPAQTTIQGSALLRGVFVGSHSLLAGFTITNGAAATGGGLYCSADSIISNCTMVGNTATSTGGGAFNQGTLTDCLLGKNTASGGGAGVSGGMLARCVLTNNVATGAGGGALNATLYNCLLAANTGRAWGGGASGSALFNCTVVSNVVLRSFPRPVAGGAGAYNSVLWNCIVFGNTGANNVEGGAANYTCATPLPTNGIGNIAIAPLFVDASGGNYRLAAGSPCINAGINQDWMIGALDLAGLSRITGGIVDMGAYEFASAERPVITASLLLSSTRLQLEWPSVTGTRYQLQSAANLPTVNWINEGVPFLGTGGVLQTSLPITAEPAKLFRLLLNN